MLNARSAKLERIDTGNHSREEYEQFLSDTAFINRHLGDRRALERTLFRDVKTKGLRELKLLDVGAGSGELLWATSRFASDSGLRAALTGIDLNEVSVRAAATTLQEYSISFVRGDALKLPFRDRSFDYVISSLFLHHLSDEQIGLALEEMARVARLGVYVIDLERNALAYLLFRAASIAFRFSPMVRHDGALSVQRGFKPLELLSAARDHGFTSARVVRSFPFRLVLRLTF